MCVTVDDVKIQLGISGTSEDAKLSRFLTQAMSIAEGYCSRTFSAQTNTEVYDGNGTNQLVLRKQPVISITSIHVSDDRVFDSTTLLTANTHYVFNAAGIVTRINGWWPSLRNRSGRGISGGHEMTYGGRSLVAIETPGIQNIQVVYKSGYEEFPADLQFAICSIVAMIRSQGALGRPIASKSIDYYSRTLVDSKEEMERLDGAKATLNRYRRRII